MEENQKKDSDKVLNKIKGKLILPKRAPEEASFLFTSTHMLIEAQERMKIPLHQIKNHELAYELKAGSEHNMVAIKISYLDDLNQKRQLSLEAPMSEVSSFNSELKLGIDKAKSKWLESLPIEERYVGFWRRFFAHILDGIILNIISWVAGLVLMFLQFLPDWLAGVIFSGFAIAFTIFSIIYFPVFWAWQGATPGKMMMGVKIVKTDGSPIGIGTAILRYIGYFISTIIIYIGFLMIVWDKRKQGLHDKIAGTCVIRT